MIKPLIKELHNPPPPVTLFNAIRNEPYPFFLDSSGPEPCALGRFSFLGCDPFLVFRCKKDIITLEWQDGRRERFMANPFTALRDILKRYAVVEYDAQFPFTCGAVGYFSYDLKDFIEDLPDSSRDDMGMPDCILGFYDAVLIYDNLYNKAHIASSGLGLETESLSEIMKRQRERLKEFNSRLSSLSSEPPVSFTKGTGLSMSSNFSKDDYIKAVEAAKRYIKKGDIYQVNLSQRFEAKLEMEPFELYARLRTFSPAPFSAYLGFKDAVIASSSPERFLLKKAGYVETRPIKGTRPRGKDSAEDARLEHELITSRKDRAEHIMIVDLERNDLGRICEYGSVSVTEPFMLEKYANVFHLVSTVSGRLKEKVGQIDCLEAVFPGGSITGAPKIRSMEIIEEIEGVKRSVYTGAIGYLSFSGDMDTSIVIRTFIIKDRRAYFQVGGGIVADSDPEKEYEETLDKAKGLMQALGIPRAGTPEKSGELVTA